MSDKPAKKFVPLREGDQPLTPDDEGELQVKVAVELKSNRVIVDFGKPVVWFGMSADDAENLANILLKNAAISRGRTQ